MIKYSEKYPEGPASALAGEIDEKTAWQILYDIARCAVTSRVAICPDTIFIDNDGFSLDNNDRADNSLYTAPEGYSAPWALAASVFFIFMGIDIFHGRGGSAQTAGTLIPIMRQGLDALNSIIADSLSFDPKRRPTLESIAGVAEKELHRLAAAKEECKECPKTASVLPTDDNLEKYWPEIME